MKDCVYRGSSLHNFTVSVIFLSRYLSYVYTSKTSKGLEMPSFLIFRREVAVNTTTAMEPLRNS